VRDSTTLLFEAVQVGLGQESVIEDDFSPGFQRLSSDEGARLFVIGLLLESVVHALDEQLWLFQKPGKSGIKSGKDLARFEAFLKHALENELHRLDFLSPLLAKFSRQGLRTLGGIVKSCKGKVIAEVIQAGLPYYRQFAWRTIRMMAELTEESLCEATSTGDSEHWSLTNLLYRAFDDLDQILGLHYNQDLRMKRNLVTGERLYEGAGVGVQTSYATILGALSHLDLEKGAHLIDLGSGYGRVGLTTGLWRSDLRFTGYEFVGHRVAVSNASAEKAGLAERVQFVEQDLGESNFVIPRADVYYMYDPFCEETYRRVLAQIKNVGREQSIAVLAKGNAGRWVADAVAGEGWKEPVSYEGGTLSLFRSVGAIAG